MAPLHEDALETADSAGLVSVLMPCYNAERFVAQALDSLLRQTYTKLEILALDDGSTDSTARILADLAIADRRVVVIRAKTNCGLISTLNRGLAVAKGEFIARMDADDISAPERITQQVTLLRRRPDLSLVGTGATWIGADDGRVLRPRPIRCLEPAGARFMSLFATPVNHTTVLARAATMRGHTYGRGNASLHTEDYELFARMLSEGINFANIPQPLITIRVDPSGVSLKNETLQVANFVTCARRHLERETGIRPAPGEHRVLVNRIDRHITPSDLRRGLQLLGLLQSQALMREAAGGSHVADDIRRVADMQRVDILLQAAKRGAPPVRLAALKLIAHHRWLVRSQAARAYLLTKFRPGNLFWDKP